MAIKYQHFGDGYGCGYESENFSKYREKIDKNLTITWGYFDKKTETDIEQTLHKSLENGVDFYNNAPDYIKKDMEEYKRLVERGVRF
ncbi:MAG: hypothetical protein RR203_02605 [Synergistaceae bacterium]